MPEEDLNVLKTLVPMGWRIALKDAYKRFHWEPPAEGEPCLTPPAQPGNGTEGNQANEDQQPNPSLASVKNSPSSSDETEAGTQTAGPEKPIGAGADPASIGKPQSFAREMPDPQVDAAGFWSSAGAALRSILGPFANKTKHLDRMTDGTLPALGTAIPNEDQRQAPKVSDKLEQASRERLASATHEDLLHAGDKVKALLQITDPAHFASRAKEILAEWDNVTANTLLIPKAADALMPVIGTAYAQGLQKPGETLDNWDPGQPRDNLGRWVDENGGGLSVKDNIQRGNKALDRSLRQKTDVQKAMHRKSLGQVDFKWGAPGDKSKNFAGGHGISHAMAKHGEASVRQIPESIARGKVSVHPEDTEKRVVEHQGHAVILAKEKKTSSWVLTAFHPKQS